MYYNFDLGPAWFWILGAFLAGSLLFAVPIFLLIALFNYFTGYDVSLWWAATSVTVPIALYMAARYWR
jgi:hypothetical protein